MLRIRNSTGISFLLCALLLGFTLGYYFGRDSTVVTFQGLPDETVIHFEVDKGGGEGPASY